VAAGPGDQMGAGATARGHLRASDADREQVIDTLKDAFAQGRATSTNTSRRSASPTAAALD
jgi:Domain of unknown function (DUF1707)